MTDSELWAGLARVLTAGAQASTDLRVQYPLEVMAEECEAMASATTCARCGALIEYRARWWVAAQAIVESARYCEDGRTYHEPSEATP